VRALVLLSLLCSATLSLAEPEDLASRDVLRRSRAARRAGESAAHQHEPRLIELLHDEEWSVRAEAARSLGLLRCHAAIRELMVLAQTDGSAEVRAAASGAVRRIDARRFVATLATADPPPVHAAPPAPPPSDGTSRRAVLLAGGLALNVLRPGDAFGGFVAGGLRWRPVEVQLSLGFPAMSLLGQLRVDLLTRGWLIPYLTAGLVLSYNNGQDQLPSAAVVGGGGLRLGPWGPTRPYGYVEILASRVILQSARAAALVELRAFSLPVLAGFGLEFWP
jgi:hypothetical protein